MINYREIKWSFMDKEAKFDFAEPWIEKERREKMPDSKE